MEELARLRELSEHAMRMAIAAGDAKERSRLIGVAARYHALASKLQVEQSDEEPRGDGT